MKKESKLYVLHENDIRIHIRSLVKELGFFVKKVSKLDVLHENDIRIALRRLVKELEDFV